jgi:hypothetical protein
MARGDTFSSGGRIYTVAYTAPDKATGVRLPFCPGLRTPLAVHPLMGKWRDGTSLMLRGQR